MIALLRKELRLAADVMAGATVFLFASFPLALLGIAMQGIKPFPWISVVGAGCVLNQYTMVLTSALLGAVTFAREREEGNQHFLALLPLTREREFAAKIAACVVTWAALWTLNVLILIGFVTAISARLTPLLPFLPRMVGVGLTSFAALGGAAFAACYIPSVTGAAVAGLCAVALVTVARLLWMSFGNAGDYFSIPFLVLLGILGTLGLAISTRTFWRDRAADAVVLAPARRTSYRMPSRAPGNAWGITRALLWKDARLQRPALLSGFALVCLPYIAAAGNAILSPDAASGFRVASLVSIALGWIVLPLWSASGLAGEWESSSHQFLAYLPVSSRRVAAAKFSIAFLPSLLVFLTGVASFAVAQYAITGISPARLSTSWDAFSETGFVTGAVAYSCALPVTFATAWFFAARLKRKIVAIVLGILSGPLAMASWAITGAPGGYVVEHFSPLQTLAIHATIWVVVSGILTVAGVKQCSNRDRARVRPLFCNSGRFTGSR